MLKCLMCEANTPMPGDDMCQPCRLHAAVTDLDEMIASEPARWRVADLKLVRSQVAAVLATF